MHHDNPPPHTALILRDFFNKNFDSIVEIIAESKKVLKAIPEIDLKIPVQQKNSWPFPGFPGPAASLKVTAEFKNTWI